VSDFGRLFGREPDLHGVAPGRVNLIGEHTDYNGGFVLPAPIPYWTRVELAAREDATVCAATQADGAEPLIMAYDLQSPTPTGGWLDYVAGVTRVVCAAGHAITGFDALVHSDVPPGRGLSSSAALDVALLRALRDRFALDFDDLALARMAQQAEAEFAGARVGIMDPLVSSLGRQGEALFVDTRDLRHRSIPIPPSMEVVVVDSGTAHRHATGGYNTRRDECEAACASLGVGSLRDLTPADLPRLAALRDPLNRRARHVVLENERVHQAVAALDRDDPVALGRLLDASHASLRDDFEVSTVTIERLVAALRGRPGVHGARITGGGFGGAVVAVARAGAGHDAALGAVAEVGREGEAAPSVVLPRLVTAAA
jgi:galactokinase